MCPRCKIFCNNFWQIISDNLDVFYSLDQIIILGGHQSQMINAMAYRILGETKHPGRVYIFLTYLFRIGYYCTKVNVTRLNLEKISLGTILSGHLLISLHKKSLQS